MNNLKNDLSKNKFNELYEIINSNNACKGVLTGMNFVTKDNINVKDTITTSGSATMTHYKSTYSATAIELLEKAGANNIAKVALDELGMGGTGKLSYKGFVKNPIDDSLQIGGSSSGSAAAMHYGLDFSLGSDTGDSIRIPAQYAGIIGFKPSYGAVSRFGLVPYSPSFDCISTFTKDFDTLICVQKIISKKDHKDLTSIKINETSCKQLEGLKILILSDPIENSIDEFKSDFKKIENIFNKNKVVTQYFKMKKSIYMACLATYLLISNAEAVQAHLAIDGIKFGDKKHIGTKLRSKFGRNTIKRYGAITTKIFNEKEAILKAYKFRRYITEMYNSYFEKYDFIVSLNSPKKTPKLDDESCSIYNSHLVIANFAGLPSITFPIARHKNYWSSLNICAKRGNDFRLIDFAKLVGEKL